MDIREKLKNGKSIYQLPLRVVFYARVSTLNEIQNTSIINQVDYFYKYIKSINNWQFIKGYVDEGISGKEVIKRENFLKMIEDAKQKKYDLVLTKSVSRFARNTIDSIKYTNLLLKYGIGIIFINDNINTFYSDSEFRLTLMASIAQDELRKLSESVKFGLSQSINRGVVLGSNNIYGYKKNNGKLIIDQNESIIIKDIYNLFLSGIYNYSNIKRIIKNKYNKRMDSNTIKRILTNPKYKGYYCGRKTEVIDYKNNIRKKIDSNKWIIYKDYVNIPPIIEESIWNKVNNIIKNNDKKITSSYKVFCSKHGDSITIKKKKYKDKYYFYFKCNDCFKISSKLFERIEKVKEIEKVYVSNDNELILKIKHQY